MVTVFALGTAPISRTYEKMKRETYDPAGITVGGTKQSDACNVIPKEVELDRFEAERLGLPSCRVQCFLGGTSCLLSEPFGVLRIRLNGVKLGASYANEVT